ncbi:MAG: DUF4145 domain-containing protein [Saprospiraceae bacterium]
MSKEVIPQLGLRAFNCPKCGLLAEQVWSFRVEVTYQKINASGKATHGHYFLPDYSFGKCTHCLYISIWHGQKMIHPLVGNTPLPNDEMPDEVKKDYLEASSIVNLSPKSASAILRLAVHKLCVHLGEKGKNINEDVKSLITKGLPEKMQQAFESVRVIGDNAVYPGQIDIDDDPETAYKLFGFINIIVDMLITQPKKIDQFYELKIPEGIKDSISKRNGKTT